MEGKAEAAKPGKDPIDELYQVRLTQDRTPMPLLSTYKDFAIPQFFQGPKFNFLKEVAIGNMSSKHNKQEDERKIFDFI